MVSRPELEENQGLDLCNQKINLGIYWQSDSLDLPEDKKIASLHQVLRLVSKSGFLLVEQAGSSDPAIDAASEDAACSVGGVRKNKVNLPPLK